MIKEDFAEQYDATVDRILSDEDLEQEFLMILDEQKAILMVDGRMDEGEAEKQICKPDNLRRTALYFL